MPELFALRDLSFTYPGQGAPALDHVELEIQRGEFWALCGPSGCGKSTLLRQLKTVLTPHGTRSGQVLFEGRALDTLDQRQQSQRIGFVLQSPENQLVTDKVWHELAFGLESLGYDTPTIRRRVAEMASFFGIQTWFHRDVAELSGGQKQLLNLASVMAMQPDVLILDEPTSQLDPIAAGDLLSTVAKINRELGTTVILTEHRLEEVFPLCAQVAVMEEGRILCHGEPRAVGAQLRDRDHAMFLAMPTPMRVWAAVPEAGERCPITVREGRDWLSAYAKNHPLGPVPAETVHSYPPEPVLEADGLWFRYEKDGPDVVRGMSLSLQKGEFTALLGGNGTGKTTALKLLAGIVEPQRGQVRRKGTVGLLPQDPQALFVKNTLREDLWEVAADREPDPARREEQVKRITQLCRLEGLLERHPFDLSGGERQRAALAKVLLLKPQLLFLDEPTKGLDAGFKESLAQLLRRLTQQGVTILMVSHDVEFCARYAHRCALFFDGGVVNAAPPRAFFSGNSFYTTSANRMARELLPQAVTAEDAIAACGGEASTPQNLEENVEPTPRPSRQEGAWTPPPLPRWRKLAVGLCTALALLLLLSFLGLLDLTGLMALLGVTNRAGQQLLRYGLFVGSLAVLGLALGRRSPRPTPRPRALTRRRLPRRTRFALVLVLLLVPLTLLAGELWLDSRKYYAVSLLILLECMVPFFLAFEGRRPQARELVLISVLCAVAVAGRMVFFMLPEFKPVVALVVLAGAAFGGEAGFLVGSMTMLASNMLFSQGPWTPWQMFAMGAIGFLSGVLFQKGLLRPSRASLCVFGSLASILIYGGIMNFQSALTWSHELNWGILLSYYATGFPMDCIHAVATWVFLWFGGEVVLEKLERVKVKYGLTERM